MPRTNHNAGRLGWLLVGLGLAFGATSAHASPADVVQWQAPAGCPDEAAVRARVEALLASGEARGQVIGLRAIVRVQREGPGYVAHVALQSQAGSRTRVLRDPDCEVAADAVAFIVATAIDPALAAASTAQPEDTKASSAEAVAPMDRSSPGTTTEAGTGANAEATDRTTQPSDRTRDEVEPEPSARAEGAASRDATPTGRLRPRLRFHRAGGPDLGFAVSVHAGAMLEPLPKLAPVVFGSLWLLVGPHFDLGAGGGYALSARQALPNDPATDVRFDRPFGVLNLCGHTATTEVLAAGLCVGLQVGATRAHSGALSAGIDRTVADVAFTSGLQVIRRLSGPLRLRVDLTSLLPLRKPLFEVNAGELVHQSGAIGFFATLGLEARFD